MYTYFLLQLCKNLFEAINVSESEYSDKRVERATAALLAFLPNREMRERLWARFLELKAQPRQGTFSACVYVTGDMISYLSDVLELETRSTGGLL